MLADSLALPFDSAPEKDRQTSTKRRVRGLDTTDPLEAVDDLIVRNHLPAGGLRGDWRESQESAWLIITEQVLTLFERIYSL